MAPTALQRRREGLGASAASSRRKSPRLQEQARGAVITWTVEQAAIRPERWRCDDAAQFTQAALSLFCQHNVDKLALRVHGRNAVPAGLFEADGSVEVIGEPSLADWRNAVAAKPDDFSGPFIEVASSAQNLDAGIYLRGPLAWHDTNGGRLAYKLKDKDAVPEGVQGGPVVAHTYMRDPGVVIAKRVNRVAEARAIPSLTVSKDFTYGDAATDRTKPGRN